MLFKFIDYYLRNFVVIKISSLSKLYFGSNLRKASPKAASLQYTAAVSANNAYYEFKNSMLKIISKSNI